MSTSHAAAGTMDKPMRQPNRPFRAEHVGSLLRPEKLQRARERILGEHTFDHAIGAHNNAELRTIEDVAIEDAVKLQEDVGLQVITDGEFRRRTWWTDFVLGFDGIVENSGIESSIVFQDKTGHRRSIPSVKVANKVQWNKSIMRDAFTFLQSHTNRVAKLTIPAPTNVHYFVGARAGIDQKAYPDVAQFFSDLAQAYNKEILDLAKAGCRYLQLDDVTIAFLCDPSRQEQVRSWGYEPSRLLDIYIDMFNQSVAGRPDNMTIGIHICRGNASSHWGAAGGYEPVADALFNKLDVDAFFLEYDSERAGGFEPLRFLPKRKHVVLGLVTTKDPALENRDGLKRRIELASKYAPLDQIALSPQCGFASNYIGNPVTIDDERKKLALVVTVAQEVWSSK
jgi:5-methyltetrahydropteroyltriglutamate--homocysteine methyltransferase